MSGKAKKSSLRQLRQKKRIDYRLMHTGKDAENESSSSDETASEIEKSPLRASQMGDSTSAAPPYRRSFRLHGFKKMRRTMTKKWPRYQPKCPV